jgi:hypothetical protein
MTQAVAFHIGYPQTAVDGCTGLCCVVLLSVALASRERFAFCAWIDLFQHVQMPKSM